MTSFVPQMWLEDLCVRIFCDFPNPFVGPITCAGFSAHSSISFFLKFFITRQLQERKPPSKNNSDKALQSQAWSLPSLQGKEFMNARRAGASLMLIFIQQAAPHATSPLLLCSKPAAAVPGEQAFTVTAGSSCPQQRPNPAARPWHPKSLCVHSGLAFRPSGCQDLGWKGAEKAEIGGLEAAGARGAALKRADIEQWIMQAHTERSAAFAEGEMGTAQRIWELLSAKLFFPSSNNFSL